MQTQAAPSRFDTPSQIDWEERRFAAEGGYDRHGECRDRPSHFDTVKAIEPAYAARDGLVVGTDWRAATTVLTISEAATMAEGFTRMAAETPSSIMARSAMSLANDLITAIHTVKSELQTARAA